MSAFSRWSLADQQHWRVETDSSGMLAKLWLVEADGSETQIKYVYGLKLDIDANRRDQGQHPVQLTIQVAGDVEIAAALGAVSLEPLDLTEEPS